MDKHGNSSKRFGHDIPKSIKLFSKSGLCDRVLKNVETANFKGPTNIQKNAIPIILHGRDILATSTTGTGKTAAYLLPVIDMIEKELQSQSSNNNNGVCQPIGLILVPARELVVQISEVAEMFANNTMVNVGTVYNAESMHDQNKRNNIHLLTGTPKKLLSLLNSKAAGLSRLKYFILDEADKMLEMGFGEEVERILQYFANIQGKRQQNIFVSATFSSEIHKLAEVYLRKDYVFLTVGQVGVACENVEQFFIPTDESEKLTKMIHMLENDELGKKVIYVRTRALCSIIATVLSAMSFPSACIHGGHSQRQRDKALMDFVSGKVDILVSTSLTARGLDIKDVQHVINHDLPDNIAEYVQRIGRTGRMGKLGKSTSFYNYTKDAALSPHLVEMLQKVNQSVPKWLLKASIAVTTEAYIENNGLFMEEWKKMPDTLPDGFDSENSDQDDYSSTDSE